MNINYKHYTLAELYEAKATIDQQKYPERFQQLQQEIELRIKHPELEPSKSATNKKANFLFLKVIMALCVTFSMTELYGAIETGAIWYKRDHQYFLATQPQGFYLVCLLHVLFIVVGCYIVFKKPPVKEQ